MLPEVVVVGGGAEAKVAETCRVIPEAVVGVEAEEVAEKKEVDLNNPRSSRPVRPTDLPNPPQQPPRDS